jgi:hypothetical protein
MIGRPGPIRIEDSPKFADTRCVMYFSEIGFDDGKFDSSHVRDTSDAVQVTRALAAICCVRRRETVFCG